MGEATPLPTPGSRPGTRSGTNHTGRAAQTGLGAQVPTPQGKCRVSDQRRSNSQGKHWVWDFDKEGSVKKVSKSARFATGARMRGLAIVKRTIELGLFVH